MKLKQEKWKLLASCANKQHNVDNLSHYANSDDGVINALLSISQSCGWKRCETIPAAAE